MITRDKSIIRNSSYAKLGLYSTLLLLAAFAYLGLAPAAANAETCRWIGETSNQMSNPANWTVAGSSTCQLNSGSELIFENNRSAQWDSDLRNSIGRIDVRESYAGTLRILGNVTIANDLKQSGGAIDISNSNLRLGGYLQRYAGTFLANTSYVYLFGASTDMSYIGGISTTLSALTVQGNSRLASNVTADSLLIAPGASLDAVNSYITLRDSGAALLNNGSFNPNNSTVHYAGSFGNSVRGNYFGLVLGSSGTHNLSGNVNVSSTFTNQGILNTGNYNLSSHGQFQNNGVLNEVGAGYIKHVMGEARFTDEAGNDISFYTSGSNVVFIKIVDEDANLNGSLRDTIAVLVNITGLGDQENITLQETGNNTGIFRNTTGVTLSSDSPAMSNNGRLEGAAIGSLSFSYADNRDPFDRRTDNATYTNSSTCGAPTNLAMNINASVGAARPSETSSREITLYFSATGATEMMITNSGFTDTNWQPFSATRSWNLTEGNGAKYVYAKFRSACGAESATYSAIINLNSSGTIAPTTTPATTPAATTTPTVCSAPIVADGAVTINGVRWGGQTTSRLVTLGVTASNAASMMISENSNFSGGIWEPYAAARSWTLSRGNGEKRIYAKFRSACDEQRATTVSWITLQENAATSCAAPVVDNNSLVINGGTRIISNPVVALTLNAAGASEMMVSENFNFAGAGWEPYATARTWTFSSSTGMKFLYAKFRSSCGTESSRVIGATSLLSPPSMSEMSCGYPVVRARPIVINGNAPLATSKTVTITLSASADYMRVSNNPDLEEAVWKPYRPSFDWILAPFGGLNIVYVQFASACGQETAVYSDSINLPWLPPATPILREPSDSEDTAVLTPMLELFSTPLNPNSNIRFSSISVRQATKVGGLNTVSLRYSYRNTARSSLIRLSRQVISVSGTSARAVRRSSALIYLRSKKTYTTKNLGEKLPDGNYTMRVEARDSRTNALLDWNAFTVNLGSN